MLSKAEIVALVVAVASSSSAVADVKFRARAGYVPSGDYSITSDLVFGSGASARPLEYEADFKAIPIGATLVFDGSSYLDVGYQKSTGDAKFAWAASQRPDFERAETTITFGTRSNYWSAYVGYKDSRTDTDWPRGYQPDVFEAKGFIFGGGVAIPIKKSAISLGFGIGRLQGEYTYSAGLTDTTDYTFGYSASVGYTYTFNRHFSLAADYRWNAYSYQWTDFTIDEELKQMSITAAFTF